MASNPPPYTNSSQAQAQTQYHISQQQTMPQPAFPISSTPPSPPTSTPLFTPIPTGQSGPLPLVSQPSIKQRLKHIIPVGIAVTLLLMIYLAWNIAITPAPLSPVPGVTQQNFGNGATSTTTKNSSGNVSTGSRDIQAYIVGAVKNPGVYTLPAGARIYALLQAAGGPLPKANLVALNLAATLTDGEEVYVTLIGEIPPSYVGGVPGPGSGSGSGIPPGNATGTLVNINTASATEMQQSLHVSSTTAQDIVNFRTQHGPFSSVDQLLQVVSRSIYDKIKGQVTIS